MKKTYRIVDLDSNTVVANNIANITAAHDLLKLYVADYPMTDFSIETYYSKGPAVNV